MASSSMLVSGWLLARDFRAEEEPGVVSKRFPLPTEPQPQPCGLPPDTVTAKPLGPKQGGEGGEDMKERNRTGT